MIKIIVKEDGKNIKFEELRHAMHYCETTPGQLTLTAIDITHKATVRYDYGMRVDTNIEKVKYES